MVKLGEGQHYDRKDSRIGKRVELPAFSDQWMRGARFGVIRSVIKAEGKPDILCVKCDHRGIKRLYRHFAENFTTL